MKTLFARQSGFTPLKWLGVLSAGMLITTTLLSGGRMLGFPGDIGLSFGIGFGSGGWGSGTYLSVGGGRGSSYYGGYSGGTMGYNRGAATRYDQSYIYEVPVHRAPSSIPYSYRNTYQYPDSSSLNNDQFLDPSAMNSYQYPDSRNTNTMPAQRSPLYGRGFNEKPASFASP